MFDKLFTFLNDIDNYEQRKVSNSEVNGLTIDTAYTSDCGYETAIIDKNGVYPVERYANKEDAINGHIKWCIEAQTIKTVIMLRWIEELEEALDVPQNLITLERTNIAIK